MEKEQEQQRSKIILLIDMDCFYVQVEQRDKPDSRGKPCAVVQYKKFKGGSILAVGYEARKFGVTRMLRGDEAKQKCPDIIIFNVPEKRGKADLTKYRLAGAEVIKVLSRYCDCVERASIDEAFLDVTSLVMDRMKLLQQTRPEGFPLITSSMLPATHVAGYSATMETDSKAIVSGMEHSGQSSSHYSDVAQASTKLATSYSEDELDITEDGSVLEDIEADEQSDWFNYTDSNLSCEEVKEANTAATEDEDTTDSSVITQQPQASREQLLTQWLSAEGSNREQLLAVAAMLTNEIREAVRTETGFTCSAGISHNKMLAKLAAGMNKPNQQTIAPFSSIDSLMDDTPIRKVRHLGGKFGQQLTDELGVTHMGQLRRFSKVELQRKLGAKQGLWLYQLCRGVDHEIVKSRQLAQSVGCGKNFLGPEKLHSADQVQHWLLQFATELAERLSEDIRTNHRRATHLGVYYRCDDGHPAVSRSCSLDTYDAQAIAKLAWSALCKSGKNGSNITSSWHAGIINLAMNASKFISDSSHQHNTSLHSYLHPSSSAATPSTNTTTSPNINSSSQQQRTNSTTPSKVEDIDEQVFNSTPIQISQKVTGSTNMNSGQLLGNSNKRSIRKVDTGGSKKNLKRKSADIQSYFTNSAQKTQRRGEASSIVDAVKTIPRPHLKEDSNSGQHLTRPQCSTTELDNELVTICCDECGEYVPADNWDEHTDYHVALQIQKSINQLSSARALSSPQATKHKSVNKGLSKDKMDSKKTKLHTLDKFYQKIAKDSST